MTKALLHLALALVSTVGVLACGMAYLRHPNPTKAFGRAMVLVAALTWYAAFGGALAGAAHAPLVAVTVEQGEAPEPDPGQVWPPDPSLAQAVWVAPKGIAFHVSAGSRTQVHPQYHLTAVGDARRVVRSLPDTTPGAHVYGANSGTVGLSLACGAGSTYTAAPAFELRGGVQPLPRQVEDLAAAAAEVCLKWALDPDGVRVLPNGQPVLVLATHRDYAVAGGYAAHRFDPGGQFAAQLRTKARWYFAQTKALKRQPAWVR